MLQELSYPVPDTEGFWAISKTEGKRFAEALAKVINAEQGCEVHADYIRNVVTATHPSTREVIEKTGYLVDLVAMIEVAKREGRSFRNAVKIVQQESGKNEMTAAIAYLQGILEEYGVTERMDGAQDIGESRFADPPYRGDPEPSRIPQRAESPAPSTTETVDDGDVTALMLPTSSEPMLEDKKQYGESIRVYAGKAALCISETTTRIGDKATVTFEVAQAQNGNYNWQGKIAFMLSVPEQPAVLGFFAGYLTKIELKGHGSRQEKAMTLVNQGDQFFLTLIMRGQPPRAVPIPADFLYGISAMLIRQMRKNDPHLSEALILQFVKKVCEMRESPRKTGER